MMDLARKLELKPSQLQEIIEYINSHKPTTKELIAQTGLSNSFVKRLGKALKSYLVGDGNRWVLKKEPPIHLPGAQVELRGIENRLREYRKDLSSDKRAFDQFRATSETLINRTKYLLENDVFQN